MDPALRAAGLRRSFLLAALRGLHLAPPADTARLDGSTAEPRTKPGTESEGEPRRGSRGSPSTHRRHQHPKEPDMNIDQIASRFIDRSDPSPGDVPIGDTYRRRWWLPIIGPTATCILNHLAASDDGTSSWQVTPTPELAFALGLGKGTAKNSPLIRSIDRLARFDFGTWDVEPGQDCYPCVSLYRTIGLVPQRSVAKWPAALQQAHAIDIAEMHRKVS